MKRISLMLLLLCLPLLCWGCAQEKDLPHDTPQIRYENTSAYYTQEDAKYTMDLTFTEPLAEGSTVELLLGENRILSFTTEKAVSHLQLKDKQLRLNQPYTLKVNGIPQRHGTSVETPEFPKPGDIPEPSQPTIPQEPMGQPPVNSDVIPLLPENNEEPTAPHEFSALETQSSPFETLPGDSADIQFGDIPNLFPDDAPTGELPPQTFTPGAAEGSNSKDPLVPRPIPQRGATAFTLKEKTTLFTSVEDAQ